MPDMTREQLLEFMTDIAQGIPGAVTVLTQMFQLGAAPAHFAALQEFNLKGSRLWLLYKDVCLTETPVLIAFLDACHKKAVYEKEVDRYLGKLMIDRDENLAREMRKELVYPAAQLTIIDLEADGTDG